MCQRIQFIIVVFTFIACGVYGQKDNNKSPLYKINHQVSNENFRSNPATALMQFTDATTVPEIIPVDLKRDQQGYEHQKFQQYVNGIKVLGGVQTLHSYRNKSYLVTGALINVDKAPKSPVISFEVASRKAIAEFAPFQKRFTDLEKETELVYYYHQGVEKVFLAYKVDIYVQDPVMRMDVYVDATNGQIVETIDLIHTADMDLTGMAKYNGNVNLKGQKSANKYRLRNQSNKIETYSLNGSTDYGAATDVNSNDTHIDEDPIAVQAHYGAQETYKFFKENYNRDSYDDIGTSIKSYVHYSTDYANAFWDGTRMTYGDGNGSTLDALVSLDIVAHEITHGITQYSAALIYKYEAGALNESFSDIFGEVVENHAVGSNDWLMGSEIFVNGGAIRSLSDPNILDDPDTYMGNHFYIGGSDHGGVHTNSGVQNYWFYLLSEGGQGINDHGESFIVDALGIEKAAAIAYRNLTTYLGTYSNFYDARTGSIQSAIDLYGNQSPEVIAVTNAWHAVGVGTSYHITQCFSGDLKVEIHFDNYPGETTWDVKDEAGSVIAGGGPYGNEYIDADYSEIIGVTSGNYYVTFYDSYGDGMCCGYGDGNYKIYIGDQLIRTGAYFASEDSTEICIEEVVTEDTASPSQPSNLQSSNITTSGFNISWDASTDNIGVIGYNIYLDGNLQQVSASTSHQFNGLNDNTLYEVTVEAVDLAGNTSAPSSIFVTTLEEVDLPPTDIQAQVTQISDSGALLQWPISTDDGTITIYHLYVNGTLFLSTTGLQHPLDNLNPATTYTVFVLAEDNAGQLSNPIPTSFTTLNSPDIIPPTVPFNLRVEDISQESARVLWEHSSDDSGVLNYDVYFEDALIATVPDNQFILNGLQENTTYFIKIRARDIHNNLSPFNETTFTTLQAMDVEAPSSPTDLAVTNITSTSAQVEWNASTDNQSVLGYDVFLNGLWIDFTQNLEYQLSSLDPETFYEVEVTAIDETDNASEPAGTNFTTISDYIATEELILGNYFESGWEGWIDGGSDAHRYRGRYSPEGSWSIRLRDNSGSKSSMTSQVLDLSTYSTISIEFLYFPSSMEPNEDFYVEYNDGSSWHTVARFISGTHFNNYYQYSAELILSNTEFNFTDAASFRIRCDASSNADKVYIDQVIIVGNPVMGIAEDLSSFENSLIQSLPELGSNDVDYNISVYPNPFSDRIFIEAEESIDRINIFSIDGKLIKSQTQIDDFGIEVSNLKNGIYILEINIDGEVHHQKMIKK